MSNQKSQHNSQQYDAQWKTYVAISVALSLAATGIANIASWYRRPVTEPNSVETDGPERKTLHSILPNVEFAGQVSVKIHAAAPNIYAAIKGVTLRDMPLAYWIGSLRYLPGRLLGTLPPGDASELDRPFLQTLQEGINNIILAETPNQSILMGTIGKFHNPTDQQTVRVNSPQEFIEFNQPDYQKLAMSFQLTPIDDQSGYRLTLTHVTHALSNSATCKFALYWVFIKPMGNFVSWLLLRAIKSIAEKQSHIQPPGISINETQSITPTE